MATDNDNEFLAFNGDAAIPVDPVRPISVTIAAAEALTGATNRRIRQLIREGEVRSRIISGRRVILYADLEAWVLRSPTGPHPNRICGNANRRKSRVEEAA